MLVRFLLHTYCELSTNSKYKVQTLTAIIMSQTNKHGISRHIPSNVKLLVRQQCGFGCVVCGSPIYDYEHWNPEFSELISGHDPSGITLCCPNCHRRKGGTLSMEDYIKAIKNPKAVIDAQFKTNWSVSENPTINVGTVEFVGGTRILVIDGETIIGVDTPEEDGAPPQLIAKFTNKSGDDIFKIDHNQCIGYSSAWDIESTKINTGGWRWVIRQGPRNILLHLEIIPPNFINIRKLKISSGHLKIHANDQGLQVSDMEDNSRVNKIFLHQLKARPKGNEHVMFEVSTRNMFSVTKGDIKVNDIRMDNMELDGEGHPHSKIGIGSKAKSNFI